MDDLDALDEIDVDAMTPGDAAAPMDDLDALDEIDVDAVTPKDDLDALDDLDVDERVVQNAQCRCRIQNPTQECTVCAERVCMVQMLSIQTATCMLHASQHERLRFSGRAADRSGRARRAEQDHPAARQLNRKR